MLDFNKAILTGCRLTTRKLSDMADYYSDQSAVRKVLDAKQDPALYDIYECAGAEEPGNMTFGTTIIHPGKIGNEYYMSKGHFHAVDSAEVYLGLTGKGLLLLQNRNGDFTSTELEKGTVVHIAPGWAHRSVNTGKEEFSYFFVYFSNAGHDYESVKRTGLKKLALEKDSGSVLVDNPNYKEK